MRDLLKEKHNVHVSVPTIINRAKELGYYIPRTERNAHERIVSTDFVGELVQHDSSHHRFSPFMDDKLYLITSLDDHSEVDLLMKKLKFLGLNFDPFNPEISTECNTQ